MKRLIKFLAFVILTSALSACTYNGGDSMNTNEQVVCGGTIDNSFDAPKVIQSKDLSSINTDFFYTEKYGKHDYAYLHIKLERNEKNELILSEENRYKVSIKVDNEVLKGSQELIEKLELSSLNGTDQYTSGLPIPYSPVHFSAKYANGESLYFCMNGNPEALWCNEIAEYFLDVFEQYGETSVLPKEN